MLTTPTKNTNTSIEEYLTPVRFLYSPQSSPAANDSSSQVKLSLQLIIKGLQDNFIKWQLAQKNGMVLCNSIEAIKTRALESVKSTNTNDNENNTVYPPELQAYCDKLAIVASIFEDITKNARESLRRLRALSKLAASDEIFYRSWQMTQFIGFVEELELRYTKETDVKRCVMCELAHGHTRADLVRSTCAWEYPQYVDGWVALMFAFLAKEINLQRTV